MSEPDCRNVWIAHYDESEVQHDARIGEAYALEEKATRSVSKYRAKAYVDLSQEGAERSIEKWFGQSGS